MFTNEHKTRSFIGVGERSVAAAARGGPSIHRAHGPLGTTADSGGLHVDLLQSCEEDHSCWRPSSAEVVSGKELGPIENMGRGRKPGVGPRINTVD
ncbi:hypothetical protein MTO96_006680 [Rhipicephalus appendiculatus]